MRPGWTRTGAFIFLGLSLFWGVLRGALFWSVSSPGSRPIQTTEKIIGDPVFEAHEVTQSPLALILEVTPAPVHVGTRYTLEYLASMRNLSNEKISFPTDFLRENTFGSFDGSGVYFKILDDKGRSIKGKETDELGEVIPYVLDYANSPERIPADSYHSEWIELASGDMLASIPMKVSPYRLELKDIYFEGGVGTVSEHVPVASSSRYIPPKKGFRFLDRYKFKKPGRYSIQIVLNEMANVLPNYPIASKIPRWLAIILWKLKVYPSDRGRWIQIRTQSKKYYFDVIP